MGLVVAELRKLSTVRTNLVLTAVGLLLVLGSAAAFTMVEEVAGPFLGTDGEVASAIDQIGGNSLIVLVVALIAMTTEFRHGTIGRTLQLTPSRTRVLSAKLAAGVVYAVVFFVLAVVVVAGVLAVAAAMSSVGLEVGDASVTALWQGVVGLVFTAALGVAVGALLRNQVLAVTLSLLWVFVVEQLINQFWPHIGRWLPFQALNAIFLSEETLAAAPEGMFQPLEPAVGLAVFVGYVVVATVVAAVLLRTRDV